MFTGIVQGTATVRDIETGNNRRRLRLGFPDGGTLNLVRGASVAVAGTCLTAVDINGNEAEFDVIDETLRRTTLGALEPGASVNFERAAKFGDEIGGHALSGHVFGIGEVVSRRDMGENRALGIRVEEPVLRYVFEKGYIGIDGISLTVGEVDRSQCTFSLHLIPETLAITTLGNAEVGVRVNVEVDAMTQAIVDTAERILPELVR